MNELWGRRVRVQIKLNPSTNLIKKGDTGSTTSNLPSEVDVITFEQNGVAQDGLRITFDVNYPGMEHFFVSEVVVYNLTEDYRNQIIGQGAVVTVEAGYSEGNDNFGNIFEGWLYQTLFEKESVTTYKLTLRCIDGERLFTDTNLVSTTLDRGMRFMTRINSILAKSKREVPLASELPEVNEFQAMYRGETIFKTVNECFNEAYGFRGVNKEANYRRFSYRSKVTVVDTDGPPYEKEAIVVSPNKGGLIGTPQITQYGADFVTLLNPRIGLKVPYCVVKIEGVSFLQMKIEYGSEKLPALLTPLQEYLVIGVRHVGDTRGSNWYTYVTGCNLTGAKPFNM